MSQEDITDPRVVPRWVEAGVSGVARAAEWDASLVAPLPELAGAPDAEIRFAVLADGTAVDDGSGRPEAIERIADLLREQLAPPFEAIALRRAAGEWFLGARRANLQALDVPETVEAGEITVAVGPDGERTVLVDGDEADELEHGLLVAVERIEELAGARHPSFVARAVRGATAWKLTVDPL